MELFGTSSINKFIKRQPLSKVPEEQAKIIFKQIVDGIKALHNRGFCHRDLKVTNMLIDQSTLKVRIIDFGFACLSQEKLRMYCGTKSYMPPELVRRIPYDGQAMDIWALGVVLFKLLTGDYPFGADGDKNLESNIVNAYYKVPFFVSVKAKDLLDKMFKVISPERSSINRVSS
jgi:MAP/microtubule affinity-regulating kinase